MIGQILKFMRTKRGYKQSELCKKINIAQTTLSGYETKYSSPTFDTIDKIANECEFEIIFRDKITKEEYRISDLERKDI